MTTLDRLARAAYRADPENDAPWDDVDGPYQEYKRYWRDQARAILRELRDHPPATWNVPMVNPTIEGAWVHALDAILAEGKA